MREDEGVFRAARFLKRLVVGVIVLAFAVTAVGYLFLMRTVDQRDAWTASQRELASSVLRYGERPERVARVYLRRTTNYLRAVNGILVATPQRLLFVGLEPRDKLAGEDAPAGIVTAEMPNDTLLSLSVRRIYSLTAHGVVARRSGRTEQFAAARGHEDELDSLAGYVDRRHDEERRQVVADRALHDAVAAVLRVPLAYTVQRGDAISTIATRFGTTPEKLREWNHLPNDRVRIGATLTVKPAG